MEAVFMNAGILTIIILCVVGLVKMPFDSFKKKYPKGYKATFTGLSIILTVAACLVDQVFILCGAIASVEFVVLLLSTFAGVFGLYNAYEGLGAKELVNRLFVAIGNLKASAPESKFSKYVDKIGVDKAFSLLAEKKIADEKKAEETKVEETKSEEAQK